MSLPAGARSFYNLFPYYPGAPTFSGYPTTPFTVSCRAAFGAFGPQDTPLRRSYAYDMGLQLAIQGNATMPSTGQFQIKWTHEAWESNPDAPTSPGPVCLFKQTVTATITINSITDDFFFGTYVPDDISYSQTVETQIINGRVLNDSAEVLPYLDNGVTEESFLTSLVRDNDLQSLFILPFQSAPYLVEITRDLYLKTIFETTPQTAMDGGAYYMDLGNGWKVTPIWPQSLPSGSFDPEPITLYPVGGSMRGFTGYIHFYGPGALYTFLSEQGNAALSAPNGLFYQAVSGTGLSFHTIKNRFAEAADGRQSRSTIANVRHASLLRNGADFYVLAQEGLSGLTGAHHVWRGDHFGREWTKITTEPVWRNSYFWRASGCALHGGTAGSVAMVRDVALSGSLDGSGNQLYFKRANDFHDWPEDDKAVLIADYLGAWPDFSLFQDPQSLRLVATNFLDALFYSDNGGRTWQSGAPLWGDGEATNLYRPGGFCFLPNGSALTCALKFMGIVEDAVPANKLRFKRLDDVLSCPNDSMAIDVAGFSSDESTLYFGLHHRFTPCDRAGRQEWFLFPAPIDYSTDAFQSRDGGREWLSFN